MGYGKLAKGLTEEEARRRLEDLMPRRSTGKKFQAYSRNVFVGSSSRTPGVLSPGKPVNSSLLDSPKQWRRKEFTIEKVASLRTSLINSRDQELSMQHRELAMAEKPANIEVQLEKPPKGQGIAGRVKPVSTSAELKGLKLGENPSVNKDIEKAFYDTDLKASTAVNELFQGNDVYSIQQSMTAGLLGEEREIVPTRNSITAVDDQASQKLRGEVKNYGQLNEKKFFDAEFLGNRFQVFLIPGRWEFELLELKRPGSTWNATDKTWIAANHEGFTGRTSYASECAGAYYAARLAVLEKLNDLNAQAKALVVREVRPDYWAPLGVWVVREGLRKALGEETPVESGVETVLRQSHRLNFRRLRERSRMLQGTQESLDSYLTG